MFMNSNELESAYSVMQLNLRVSLRDGDCTIFCEEFNYAKRSALVAVSVLQ